MIASWTLFCGAEEMINIMAVTMMGSMEDQLHFDVWYMSLYHFVLMPLQKAWISLLSQANNKK